MSNKDNKAISELTNTDETNQNLSQEAGGTAISWYLEGRAFDAAP